MLFLDSMRDTLKANLRANRVPPQDCEDLLNETFLVLLQRWHNMQGIACRKSWLLGTLYKKIATYWRTHKLDRRLRTGLSRQPPRREPPLQDLVLSAADVEKLFALIPPRDQQLLWCHYALELSEEEAAQQLDCSPSSVRKLCNRALKRTRTKLAVVVKR